MFSGTSILFSILAVPVYIAAKSITGLPFHHTLFQQLLLVGFLKIRSCTLLNWPPCLISGNLGSSLCTNGLDIFEGFDASGTFSELLPSKCISLLSF